MTVMQEHDNVERLRGASSVCEPVRELGTDHRVNRLVSVTEWLRRIGAGRVLDRLERRDRGRAGRLVRHRGPRCLGRPGVSRPPDVAQLLFPAPESISEAGSAD
jgi:hypothetical protein